MVTVKLSADTRQMLRILAAHSGKSMHRVAAELAWAEMKRLRLPLKSATNGTKGKGAR
jgi:hypothetical protein